MNFSERKKGLPVRDQEILSDRAWHGLISLVDNLIDNNFFGKSFPYICGNCGRNGGFDNGRLNSTLYAELGIENGWIHFKTNCLENDYRNDYCRDKKITDEELSWIALDLIEFCFQYCAMPKEKKSFSGCWSHGGVEYTEYDVESFREEWHKKINNFFSKHGLAYELNEKGEVIRLLNEVFKTDFAYFIQTNDDELDRLLQKAKDKFLKPKIEERQEAIMFLWDAWERIKTLDGSKALSIESIFLGITKEKGAFFDFFNEEGKKLTGLGNGNLGNFIIRHSEIGKVSIEDPMLIDYFFHRLFCLITLILKSKKIIRHAIDS